MFPHRRLSSSLRPCLRNVPRLLASSFATTQRRGLAASLSVKYTTAVASTAELQVDTIEENELSQPETDSAAQPTSYREFMEKIGYKYQYAYPMSYLGSTPFPMNPSFKPPPPISDEQKEVIFRLYISHRLENGPRRLAKRFNISLKRVNAIIRLKLLEKTYEKQTKRKLQTGFQVGMERLLGATTHSSVPDLKQQLMKTAQWLEGQLGTPASRVTDRLDPLHPSFESPEVNVLRSDVHKADILEEEEQRDASIAHYERLYWESVQEDGREPLMPSILQTEKQRAQMRKLNAEAKASRQFLVHKPQTEFLRRPQKQATFVVGRPRGRKGPVTKFLDVGGQFMDLEERIRALSLSQRRAAKRQRKAEEEKNLYVKP